MKIGILGTGHVACLLSSAWANAGHEITLGSRDPGAKRLDFPVNTLADTVRWADVVVNATTGAATLATLSAVDPGRFAGKTLIDVANAITPAFALVYPNSSLAERLQAALLARGNPDQGYPQYPQWQGVPVQINLGGMGGYTFRPGEAASVTIHVHEDASSFQPTVVVGPTETPTQEPSQ